MIWGLEGGTGDVEFDKDSICRGKVGLVEVRAAKAHAVMRRLVYILVLFISWVRIGILFALGAPSSRG